MNKQVDSKGREVTRLGKGGSAQDKAKKEEFEILSKIAKWVCEDKRDVRDGEWNGKEIEVINTLQLITAKPVVYLVSILSLLRGVDLRGGTLEGSVVWIWFDRSGTGVSEVELLSGGCDKMG